MTDHPVLLIGKFISQKRKEQGLSIEKLAAKSQLSSSQISVIERGHNPLTGKYNNITLSSLELIGNGLGLSVQEILEKSGYFNSFHDTIKLSEKHLTRHLQDILSNQFAQLNDTNKEKAQDFIESLLYSQRKKQ